MLQAHTSAADLNEANSNNDFSGAKIGMK